MRVDDSGHRQKCALPGCEGQTWISWSDMCEDHKEFASASVWETLLAEQRAQREGTTLLTTLLTALHENRKENA